MTDVILSNHTDKARAVPLQPGDTRVSGQSGSLARINDVPMPATGGDHVRVFFKEDLTTTGATLEVTMSAAANSSSCTDPRTPGDASAISFLLTVVQVAPWVERTDDETDASGRFSRYALLDSTTPTATGIRIHRSSTACTSTDVALASGTPSYLGLDLHGDSSGVTLASSHAGVAMPGTGAGDRHLRLYFAAGATVAAGMLDVTVTLTADCAAADDLPDPQQVIYRLDVYTPDAHAWVRLGQDSERLGADPFKWSDLDDDLDTGIALHRNSMECKQTDVELLGGSEHLELGRYAADGTADGEKGVRFAAVPMETGGAADRHVRLLFKESYPSVTAITATIRISAAATCTSRRNPDPATFMYTLNVDADFDPPPALSLSSTEGRVFPVSGPVDARLTVTATDNDDADVTVTIDTESARTFELRRLGSGVYALWKRVSVAVEEGEKYTVVFTATDDGRAARR